MTTAARRFETLADAFLFSATEGGLIFGLGGWPNYLAAEYYVIPFGSVEWAEACGMSLVDGFDDLM